MSKQWTQVVLGEKGLIFNLLQFKKIPKNTMPLKFKIWFI